MKKIFILFIVPFAVSGCFDTESSAESAITDCSNPRSEIEKQQCEHHKKMVANDIQPTKNPKKLW